MDSEQFLSNELAFVKWDSISDSELKNSRRLEFQFAKVGASSQVLQTEKRFSEYVLEMFRQDESYTFYISKYRVPYPRK